MERAIILVMDSFGIGSTPDAESFGDQGANTYGSILKACALGKADRGGLRRGKLAIPNLAHLGLDKAAALATGADVSKMPLGDIPAAYGCAAELSRGKDTPSGHWEMAGQPVLFDWGYFPKTQPTFPPHLIAQWLKECDLPGILGDCHASGTEIIEALGEDHLRTGKPICYTSADSVFQIAAHEQQFGLDRLYAISKRAKKLLEPLNIGRVIARPFVGFEKGAFKRTANRKDFTTPPPGPTLLDHAAQMERDIYSVGKIADIFAHQNTGVNYKAEDNDRLFDATLHCLDECREGGIIFANFVDFDTLYGHRRDVSGYAAALEAFDRRLPELQKKMKEGDIALISADHGCDPTWPGTDHTREYVPCVFFGATVPSGSLGVRESFADMGQTLAKHLGLAPLGYGKTCF